ncbi:MAG: PAS domain S-box protein [Bacteroidota bacterium]
MALVSTVLDAMREAVFIYPLTADGPLPFVAFNRAALDGYGYSEEDLRAMTVEDLVFEKSVNVEDALHLLWDTHEATFQSVHVRKDGSTLSVETAARLIEYEDQLCVLSVCREDEERRAFQNDVLRANLRLEREATQRTAALEAFADDLRILHRITTAEHDSPSARYEAFLRAGCEMFDLPLGLLAETPEAEDGERLYRLKAVVSPDPEIAAGLTIPLREAFCDHVVETGGTVTYADAQAEAPEHPACVDRGLRAYIGTPIHVDGEWFGTVSFVSPEPRREGFTSAEHDLIEVMATAIGRQLAVDRAEAEHVRAVTWYRAIFETVDAAIAIVGPDGTVRECNEAARDVLGIDDGLALPAARVTVKGVPFEEQPETRALREAHPVRNVLQGLPSGGGMLWFNVSAAPVDETLDGEPDAAMVVFQEVTPLRNEMRRAKRYGQMLASVLAASPDGVMAFRAVRDGDGAIQDFEWFLVNPRAGEIVGKDAGELVGQRLLEVFPGNRDSGFFDAYVEVVETGEPYQTSMPYAYDGFETTFRVHAAPLPSEDGFTVSFSDLGSSA